MTESAPRPRQVTLASVIAGIGASLVLINIFSVMADWGSASVREQVEGALEGGPFGPADVSVDTALSMLRIMLMVVAAGCVAAVVFAVYTARRHRAARIGLTVLAGAWAVLSLALGLAGLLLAAIAVGCVVLLWSAEARKWFATSKPPRVAATGAPPIPPPPNATSAKGMPTVMSTPPPPDEPDQPTTWGSPGDQESSAPPPSGSPERPAPPPSGSPQQQPPPPSGSPPQPPPSGYTGYGPPPPPGSYQPPHGSYMPPPPAPQPAVPTKRPGTLTAAGVITIVMSGLALIVGASIALWFLFDRESMERNQDFRDASADWEMSVEDYVTTIGIYFAIVALLSLAAVVVAILLLMNKRVRIPLVVLSGMTIVVGLFSVVWPIAAILVIVFCFVGGANAWYDVKGYAADRARQQR